MKTIVVGYDGTRPAERALRRAGGLAVAFGSRVVVVDVAAPTALAVAPGAFGLVPYPYLPTEEDGSAEEALWRRHRAEVETLLEDLGVPFSFAGVVGSAVEEIIDAAQQGEADLVVVGTRDAGFLERLLSGTVSVGVARRAPCDVLIVREPGETA